MKPFVYGWQEDLSGVTFSHVVALDFDETTELPLVDLNQAYQRLICCVLIDRLPAKGLTELCETIGEIYEHYTTPERQILLQPVPQKLKAVLGKPKERAVFSIEEE